MSDRYFSGKNVNLDRRDFLKLSAALGGALAVGAPTRLFAESAQRISIATGGMGGVYFVMGGGVAGLLTKYAGVEAAAEVTAASVDNCKLIGAKKSDLAFVMGIPATMRSRGRASSRGGRSRSARSPCSIPATRTSSPPRARGFRRSRT